jgi:hypothetical protein
MAGAGGGAIAGTGSGAAIGSDATGEGIGSALD